MTDLYLARLKLNASRVASLWVSNPYRVHQRLMLAYSSEPRLLFRIELEDRGASILIQSHSAPDWERAFGDFEVLACSPEQKRFSLALQTGGTYRFRLLANPTVKRAGKRLGLSSDEDQLAWLQRKLAGAGARLLAGGARPWTIQRSERNPAKDPHTQTHLSALFEGVLAVEDSPQLCAAVEAGIGSAKGYGFGLLSLARA